MVWLNRSPTQWGEGGEISWVQLISTCLPSHGKVLQAVLARSSAPLTSTCTQPVVRYPTLPPTRKRALPDDWLCFRMPNLVSPKDEVCSKREICFLFCLKNGGGGVGSRHPVVTCWNEKFIYSILESRSLCSYTKKVRYTGTFQNDYNDNTFFTLSFDIQIGQMDKYIFLMVSKHLYLFGFKIKHLLCVWFTD